MHVQIFCPYCAISFILYCTMALLCQNSLLYCANILVGITVPTNDSYRAILGYCAVHSNLLCQKFYGYLPCQPPTHTVPLLALCCSPHFYCASVAVHTMYHTVPKLSPVLCQHFWWVSLCQPPLIPCHSWVLCCSQHFTVPKFLWVFTVPTIHSHCATFWHCAVNSTLLC